MRKSISSIQRVCAASVAASAWITNTTTKVEVGSMMANK